DAEVGQLSTFRWGVFLANLVLNLFHLGLWFACLWLLLRFQWAHAVAVALLLWLVMTLAVLPMLFNRAKAVREQQPQTAPTAREPVPAGLPGGGGPAPTKCA